MPNRTSLIAVAAFSLSLIFPASISTGQDASANLDDIRSDITAIEAEISEAEVSNGNYQGGALALIASLNLETLRLTKSVLEARLAAEESGAPIEIIVPAVQPDPALAGSILAEIQTQQANVDAAKAEAASSGGLMQALALTRYETEKLSLAQLRQAWFRAQYGIAFPTSGTPQAPTPVARTEDTPPADEVGLSATSKPDWADPNHPEIDYDMDVFKQLAAGDFTIVGWWGLEHSRAALDDSPQVFAINVSDYGTGYSDHPSLKVLCHEGEARVIFDADSFIMGDFQSNTLPVTVRIGDEEAMPQRWSKLTSNKGAGLFGSKAQDFIRKLVGSEKVFMRLEGDRGQLHDLSLKMDGSERVFDEVASACQFSLLDLGRDDYRAIQTLLNAAGFDAGTPDGKWGPGSRSAMADFQASVGLPETGAPDRATLVKMGILQE
jgi:Putative peptidoglycan binding domain